MSAYENAVGGKLKLKGKALDVKDGGIKKKKKRNKHSHAKENVTRKHELPADETDGLAANHTEDLAKADKLADEGHPPSIDDRLTPSERRYIEQKEKINMSRLAKMASKSHRDRIQEFNQYLANLSEHYDIPKVGPG
ncbi:uncharacterized protein LOC141819214 [Curcuma longa]|uniref:uncharacterized protein LOC141819214 n=1 Tax=Curcuma longa TaxID=136217 RepID=UPI003D9F17DD